MNEQTEIRAKSLEIAALILGSSPGSPLDKYLSLAGEIADYINGAQADTPAKGGGVGFAPVLGT
jgi:hypothetical protein